MLQSFTNLPQDSRLWVFASDRQLSAEESKSVHESLTQFLKGWEAHGAAVEAGFELQHDRFLLIGSSNAMADPFVCWSEALALFRCER